jgi:hypothetical protein
VAVALAIAACGSNKQRDCATGTIPDPSGADQCVPDGTVICGNGTTYDMTSGKCVAGGQCPMGQVLVNGTCTDNVTPNAEEAAEPNDMTSAGTITVPAVGAAGFVVHGCITPRDANATADIDPWQVTVTGPTLLDVTADGVGGLAAGFVVQPNDPNLAALDTNGWKRFGINLTGTMSHRQIFLPAAGTYDLVMADSRQLFLQESVAGSDQTCYFTTVTQLALPTPTPIAQAQSKIGGEVQFYSFTPAEGDLFDVSADMPSAAANASVVFVNNGAYRVSNEESVDQLTGAPTPAAVFAGGMKASDQVVIAVDTTYNYAIAPADVTVTFTPVHAQALPTNGSVTVTDVAGSWQAGDPLGNMIWLYFDVAHDGDIVHFDETFSKNANWVIVDANTAFVAKVSFPGDPALPNFHDWVRFATAGRYYAVVLHPGATAGATSTIMSKLTPVSPAAITIGTPISNHDVNGALNSAWFTLDPSAQTWIKLNAMATAFTGQIKVTFYPSDGVGRFDTDITQSFAPYTFNANGTTNHGRITSGDPSTYVVRVEDTGTPGGAATFNLTVAMQDFTDLGMVTSAQGVDKTGESLGGNNNRKLYFVKANAGDVVTFTVHPATGFVPTLDQLGVDEGSIATGTPSGTDRVIVASVASPTWLAFAVSGAGTNTNYDVHVTAVTPAPYTVSTGTLAFSDACTGGTTVALHAVGTSGAPADDEGLSNPQALPVGFGFKLYAAPVSSFVVSSNGWLSFGNPTDADLSNKHIPTAGEPDGFLAPYWDDLENVVVCKKVGANTVTVQWTGDLFDDPTITVQMQAVMHSNGTVDFIYGANQKGDGSSATGATVGAENLAGNLGNEIVFGTAGITPSSSRTLTP